MAIDVTFEFEVQRDQKGVCKLCLIARCRPSKSQSKLTILRSPRQPISNDCKSSRILK
jgi:hypothetical protein